MSRAAVEMSKQEVSSRIIKVEKKLLQGGILSMKPKRSNSILNDLTAFAEELCNASEVIKLVRINYPVFLTMGSRYQSFSDLPEFIKNALIEKIQWGRRDLINCVLLIDCTDAVRKQLSRYPSAKWFDIDKEGVYSHGDPTDGGYFEWDANFDNHEQCFWYPISERFSQNRNWQS